MVNILQEQVSLAQRWCGRPVKAFDATTLLMSDTDDCRQNADYSDEEHLGLSVDLQSDGHPDVGCI